MGTTRRGITRRTAWACVSGVVAAGAAIALNAAIPPPLMPSPPTPKAARDLPDAPGTIRLPASERPSTIASALAALPGGSELVWAEHGVVRRGTLTADGVQSRAAIAALDVAPGTGGGVRGLTALPDGRVFASFVRASDRRLLVAEIGGLRPRIVWSGPRSNGRLVGGGLAALPGGRLVLGVGDQGRRAAAADHRSILGRVVTLDPDGQPDQLPHRRSRGWHDPTALAVGRAGQIWVADRAAGDDAERLGRADRPRAGTVRSSFRRAPVALAVSGDGRTLLVCGRRSGRIDRTLVRGVVAGSEPRVLRARCRFGIAVVGERIYVVEDDGRIRFAGSVDALREAAPIDDGGQAK